MITNINNTEYDDLLRSNQVIHHKFLDKTMIVASIDYKNRMVCAYGDVRGKREPLYELPFSDIEFIKKRASDEILLCDR